MSLWHRLFHKNKSCVPYNAVPVDNFAISKIYLGRLQAEAPFDEERIHLQFLSKGTIISEVELSNDMATHLSKLITKTVAD